MKDTLTAHEKDNLRRYISEKETESVDFNLFLCTLRMGLVGITRENPLAYGNNFVEDILRQSIVSEINPVIAESVLQLIREATDDAEV